MKRLFVVFLALLFSGAVDAAEIYVVPLKGEVSQAQFFFLRRALKEAEREKAAAIILEMDTYGGELKAATNMLDALFKSDVETITYINTNAGSAGALIALSTKQIYMAPVSAIGAAAPVMGGGQDLPTTIGDKTVSYFSGYFRSAAERNGYNPDIAEAFINKEKEVKIGEEMIHAKGSVLTLSAQEATRVIEGEPLLADGVAESLDAVLKQAGITGTIKHVTPTGFEKLAFWITALAPVFLLVGILGIYLEFKLQGALIPGIVGVTSLLIFFLGHYLAGLSGWEVMALFFLGLVFILADLLIFPGTFFLGAVGVLMVLGSMFVAMIDHYPGGSFWPEPGILAGPVINLSLAIVAAGIGIALLAKYLPRTAIYGKFALSTSNPRGPSFSMETISSPRRVHVGEAGVSRSALRPSGNAAFADMVVDVVTRGEYVENNKPVRVIAIEGSRVVVEETAAGEAERESKLEGGGRKSEGTAA